MRTNFSRCGTMLLVVLAIGAAGCGNTEKPTLVTAAGEVKIKGQPLTAGSIIFFPGKTAEYQDDSPSSLLQEDGTFTMKTFPFGDGVAPGKYKVCLSKALATAIKFPEYADPQKTPWEVDIPDTGNSEIELQVK